ncbi:hypothetical protein Dimus_030494 [Dionaea muscipula]
MMQSWDNHLYGAGFTRTTGCRLVIGVNERHLKGPYKGVCLTAVGLDANSTIFPFAYAIVVSVKRET